MITRYPYSSCLNVNMFNEFLNFIFLQCNGETIFFLSDLVSYWATIIIYHLHLHTPPNSLLLYQGIQPATPHNTAVLGIQPTPSRQEYPTYYLTASCYTSVPNYPHTFLGIYPLPPHSCCTRVSNSLPYTLLLYWVSNPLPHIQPIISHSPAISVYPIY